MTTAATTTAAAAAAAASNGCPDDDSDDNVDYRVVPPAVAAQQIPLSAISSALRLMLKRLEESSVRIVDVAGVQVLDNVQGMAELLLINDSVLDYGTAGSDTVGAVLDAWDRQDPRASCARLWELLVSLGRYDILRDIRRRLLLDVRLYLERRRRQQPEPPRPPTAEVELPRFDVYVSYCENCHDDSAKAAEIVDSLSQRGLRVISAEDRHAGVFSLEEYAQIILRCSRVLVLWSRAYRAEAPLRFELSHARSLDPAADRRRVIPVLLDDTPVPDHMAGIVAVRFGHRTYLQKLYNSLTDSGVGGGIGGGGQSA